MTPTKTDNLSVSAPETLIVTSSVAGAIAYFNLTDWWLTCFSVAERERIESLYHPPGAIQARPLTQGRDVPVANTAADLLASLATWLYRPVDRPLARRVLAKAGAVAVQEGRILELHYTYQVMIQIYYRDRHDPTSLAVAMEACKKMIALAPQAAEAFQREFPQRPLPRHYGFNLLSLLQDRRRNYHDVIRLCQMAFDQGWDGDWQRRIDASRVKLRIAQADKSRP
ncbi:MAG: hypothetical protein JO316_02455 [Abitibacteriaceae bacterium]|nr:hypothetical protein [Abditibacteriaceae bacterium]MBV9864190.1 hypothetical protein [Abditibacteriaceae bacterium]